jgi:hypothetical protein
LRTWSSAIRAEIAAWLDELPEVLDALAVRWQVEWGSLVPRGHLPLNLRWASGQVTLKFLAKKLEHSISAWIVKIKFIVPNPRHSAPPSREALGRGVYCATVMADGHGCV